MQQFVVIGSDARCFGVFGPFPERRIAVDILADLFRQGRVLTASIFPMSFPRKG